MQRTNTINSITSNYNYKNYGGNFLTPFLDEKTIMIVYVHGFLGNNNTFHDFPELIKATMKLYNVRVINEVFPAFDTNGEFDKFVAYIIDWLYNHSKGYPIILMGHSMGGILIADVYRKIVKGDVDVKYKLNYETPKIYGVLGFDSPFFGVSSSIANAGVRKLKESLTAATSFVASYFTANNNIEDDIDNKLIENKSENKLIEYNNKKEEKETAIQRLDTNNNSNVNENSASSRWSFLSNLVLGTATVAAVGSSLFDQATREALIDGSRQILNESTSYLANYYKFLEPLIEITKQYERVDDLINYSRRSIINGKERFKFKNYYPITQTKNNDGTIGKSTFICLPLELRYLKFFDPIPGAKNAPDVVYSHTKMFNSQINIENMHILADKCIVDLYKIVRTLI
ncbi:hypothetical protein BCR32DRAFT_292754 [Anaeromyces robustus]|jgi:ABC-type multidrug transport system fused ATPase/permease subunit|uniref:DUF676 domain-containing protein n=1 Tax=Anaeromyces robustus TaxID=1754192 RepID=A0A1Y1X964_9FUNG|nr:hypothetical protein BCR32DRAFT_292754 [Anaeromyces robustus]|eukprot:ORX82258.1 hypothetical protein BCR32DRAFT_292754 [Anaeromyces robustus]